MKNIIVFLLLAFVLTSCSCRKKGRENEPCKTVKTAPEDFLKYWFFPEGSWWVYKLQDTTAEVYDTVRVGYDSAYYYYQWPENNYGLRRCVMNYAIKYDHSDTIFFKGIDKPGQDGFDGVYNEYTDEWEVSHLSENRYIASHEWILSYPFKVNKEYDQGLVLTDTASTIITPSGEFKSVVVITGTTVPPEGYIGYEEIYLKHGIGFIKYKFSDGHVWELVHFEIK